MTDSTHGASKGWAVAGMVLAVLFWGTQFPLSQHVLQSIDQYYFGVLRYGIGVALFALTLAWREGANAFSLRGRAVEIAWLGICGFTVFGLLAFWALYHTSPAHVSIILSSQPMVTALWLWVGYGRRPAAHTFVCLLVALGGLALIITRGDVGAALAGGSLMGDALALVAMAGWIIYTLGAQRFPGFSPLRFTTLTCIAGTAGIVLITAILTVLGVARMPEADTVLAQLPAIVYIGVFPFYIAIFLFAIAVARLGAVNTLLLANATPVAVFAIEAMRGHPPLPVELAGAAIVIGALVANNLIDHRARGLARVAA